MTVVLIRRAQTFVGYVAVHRAHEPAVCCPVLGAMEDETELEVQHPPLGEPSSEKKHTANAAEVLLFSVLLEEDYRKIFFHVILILIVFKVIHTEQASTLNQRIKF